jgi:hypothetical protein
LKLKQAANESFSIREFSEAIGTKESTVKTYVSKKLDRVCLKKNGHSYSAFDMDKFTAHTFREHMSQTSPSVKEARKGVWARLKGLFGR